MVARISRILSSLPHFLAVAEELHFGRAAERIGTTQPPLSRRIANLEMLIGVALFRRNRNIVELTDAGLELKLRAMRTMGYANELIEDLRRIERGIGGLLRVGFVSSAAFSVLPPIVRRFNELHPKIELALQEATTLEQIRLLQNNETDLGLMRSPGSDATIEVHARYFEDLIALLPRNHKLADRPSLNLSDLIDTPFIGYSRKNIPRLNDVIQQMCEVAGFSPLVVQEANQIPTIVALVGAGLGVAIVPASTQRQAGPNTVCMPLKKTRQVGLEITSRIGNRSRLAAAFIETAREVISSEELMNG